MMRFGVTVLGLFLLLAGSTWANVNPSGPPMVREVRIDNRGPGPLDEDSIRAFLTTRAGQPYDAMAANQDVRALLETGRFSDVVVAVNPLPARREVDVIFEVRNKPRLRSIQVTGADHVSNRRVRDWLQIDIGSRVDDVLMAVRAQNVYEEYRKRFFLDPKLTWEIDVNPATGAADVRVTVDEGRRASIWRIGFEGNDEVRSRSLRRVMQQKNWRPWASLTKRNRFDPYELNADRDSLRRVYMERGFLDVRIGDPIIEEGPGQRVTITIPVEEGPLYRVGEITVEGVSLFELNEIRPALTIGPGDVARTIDIERSRANVRDFYGSRGFIRTRVRERLEPDFDTAIVDIEFFVTEGELSHIRDIEIRGNRRTRDKVIRRELAVMPGDIYDEVRVRRSETRLMNMGYFNRVRVFDQPTREPNRYDLIFDVEEGRTGELSAGAGFSSIDRVIGFASIAQNNFDLFGWPHFTGGGQRAQLQTQFGSRRTDVNLYFVEPWFLDRQLEFDVNLFRRDLRYFRSEYEQRSIGGIVGLAWPVGRFSRLRVAYGLQEFDIRNVRESASDIIKEEEGKRSRSAVSVTLRRDTRNRPFVPTRGNLSVFTAELAGGPLQGDTDLYGLSARTSQFFPLWFDHVLSFRGAAEVVEEYGDSDRVPIFDRLFLGGMRDIRGFRFQDVGPKDENGQPIGGRSSAFFSAEYTVPVLPIVRLATFYDIGMVWEDAYDFSMDDLNSAVGVGVRFDIQGFPLRFDYAWPLETDEFNDRKSGRFSFMIGHVF